MQKTLKRTFLIVFCFIGGIAQAMCIGNMPQETAEKNKANDLIVAKIVTENPANSVELNSGNAVVLGRLQYDKFVISHVYKNLSKRKIVPMGQTLNFKISSASKGCESFGRSMDGSWILSGNLKNKQTGVPAITLVHCRFLPNIQVPTEHWVCM